MPCQPFLQAFWCIVISHFTDNQRIKSNYIVASNPHIRLRSVCLLIGERKACEKTVKHFLTAIEIINCMMSCQLFYFEGRHAEAWGFEAFSKTLCSWKSFSMRTNL